MSRSAESASALPADIDVAIVGAGVQGLSTALFLSRAGRDVVVFERGDPWREASGVNAGSLAIQNKLLPLVPFAREAVRMWATFQRELGDVGFVPCGGLRAAESDDDVARLRESADQQRALGVTLEWLEGRALRERAPWIGPSVVAATFCAEDSFGIPLPAGRTLLQAVEKAGGRVRRTRRSRIDADGDRLRLDTPRGAFAAARSSSPPGCGRGSREVPRPGAAGVARPPTC